MKIALACLALMVVCVATGEIKEYNATLDSFEVTSATEALNDCYLSKDGNAVSRVPVEVLKSTKQLVSGTLYRLALKFIAGEKSEVCDIEVWTRPWLSDEDAVKPEIIACQYNETVEFGQQECQKH